MIGQTVSHYRILAKLGEGGMGVVYKAEDTKLKRVVALKFLPHHVSVTPEVEARFLQEAQSAATLNHPNICTIHDIKEHDGQQFIVMECVDGVTLRKKITTAPLKPDDAVAYALQIGDALQEAHSKGIVHRDIKTDNIMINIKNQAKVMDFGLAKLKGSLKLTKVSSTVGTLAYMAPEQIQGGEVDGRSDIFSFGVLLFEMLVGRMPFRGEHDAAMMYSILNEESDTVQKYRQDASPELDRIIHRALEKDPADRYQHVDDMVSELRRMQKISARVVRSEQKGQSRTTQTVIMPIESPKKSNRNLWIAAAVIVLLAGVTTFLFLNKSGQTITSIAVLPFQNKSSDADTEYLSDGLAESLIYRLSQLPNLKVSPTSSVFHYKGKEIEPVTIGNALGVSAVMSGRMVQRGENLTISVELIDVRNNKLLWGEQYERKMSELLATQREIATEITNKLQLKLSGADAAKVEKNYTANVEAYQLYLKGRFYGSKRTAKDAQKSIEYFQQAAVIDPNYALAYAGLAESNWFLALYSYPQVNEVVPKARELALKALELDNSLAEPHSILGVICFNYDRDFACMERETKLAIELNPNYAEGHRRYGLLLSNLGRFEEARIATNRALEIDPLSPVTNAQNAQLLFFEGKYEESEAQSKKNVELDPNFWYAHLQLFFVYRMKRDYASAVEELAKVQDARGEPDAAKLIRENVAEGDWRGFLRKITEERTRLKIYPYFVATFFAELGEKDKAFATLNEAIETRDQHTALMKVDPYMNPLRDDPRFATLLKKVGFEK